MHFSQDSTRAQTILITAIFSLYIGITYGFSMDLFSMLIPDMMKAIGFGYVEAGAIASTARIGFLIASLLAGFVAPRFGNGRTIIAAVLLSLICQLGMGLSVSVGLVTVCAAGLGLASSMVYVPMVAVVTRKIPFEHRAKVFGIVSSGQSYADFAVGIVAPAVLGLSGWRAVWLTTGSIGGMILLVSCLYLWSSGVIERRIDRNVESNSKAGPILNRSSVMIWLIMLLSGGATYPYQTFISAYIQDELQLPVSLAGQVWSIIGFVGMWGGFAMGFVADRAGVRTALILCYLAMLGAAVLTLLHMGSAFLMTAAGLFGLAYFSMYGLFPAYISKSFDEGSATKVFGIANVLLGLSTTLGSFVGGFIKANFGTFQPVYIAISGISIALVALTASLRQERAVATAAS